MLKKQSRRHLNRRESALPSTTDLSASEAVGKTRMRIWASRSDYTHFMSLEIMLTTVLETETHTFLLNLYLNTRLASFCQQHKKSDMKEMIRKTCKKIQKYLHHSNISRNLITDKKQIQWAESWQDQIFESEKRIEQQAMKHNWKK